MTCLACGTHYRDSARFCDACAGIIGTQHARAASMKMATCSACSLPNPETNRVARELGG